MWGARVLLMFWLTLLQVISLFLIICKSFWTWRASINTPLVAKFVIESVPTYLLVVSLLLTKNHFRSGVSYYIIVTTVLGASIIAMTDEKVRLKINHHHH